MDTERQCELVRGTTHKIVWVPMHLCKIGSIIDGWGVIEVWRTRRWITENGLVHAP
jgi:hypothetical protein